MSSTGWAIDLGTTNTGIARWDPTSERPRMLQLDEICRAPDAEDPLEAPRLVPSATHMLGELDFWTRVGAWPLLSKRVFWGRRAWIGRPALDRNTGEPKPNFALTFKPYLARSPLQTIARAGGRNISARDVARTFVRELFAEVHRTTGERIRKLTVTTPVDSFESYRAEVAAAFKDAGVRELKFVDEPVAAAIGYGLGLKRERIVLVVDFGGGTLDLALVRMTAREMQDGVCEVIAKAGRPIGGNHVDRWLLEEFCNRLGYPLSEDAATDNARFWYRMMLAEACRVKEEVFFNPSATFLLTPPEELRSFEARIHGDAGTLDITKDDIVQILTDRGLYRELEECVAEIDQQMRNHGMSRDDIGDVLMVGGSTLLPNVYPLFEEAFGRGRVRAFQPFEAVAWGASAFSAGGIQTSDFIVHDYALVTYDLQTHEPQYQVIIKRGTRFPTRPNQWERKLVPTCSLGEPERIFKLVIAEIGSADSEDRRFSWDRAGQLHKIGGENPGSGAPLVVPLNEQNPTLGTLDPPHPPGDRTPRLEISFGVNADRWLIATVKDLKTSKVLLNGEPVVQLL